MQADYLVAIATPPAKAGNFRVMWLGRGEGQLASVNCLALGGNNDRHHENHDSEHCQA